MHTVTCVRTLSIGPRRHGPRLCMFRPRAAKVALRRSPARARRCSARALWRRLYRLSSRSASMHLRRARLWMFPHEEALIVRHEAVGDLVRVGDSLSTNIAVGFDGSLQSAVMTALIHWSEERLWRRLNIAAEPTSCSWPLCTRCSRASG